jgi:hypothetical protein
MGMHLNLIVRSKKHRTGEESKKKLRKQGAFIGFLLIKLYLNSLGRFAFLLIRSIEGIKKAPAGAF